MWCSNFYKFTLWIFLEFEYAVQEQWFKMQRIWSVLSRLNVTQASPTWLSNRTCLCEPSRAAVSTTPLLRSHQKRRSSVKSMVKPLGDTRLVLATITRLFPSKDALSTTGWSPISVQNNFLKIKRSIVRKKPPICYMTNKLGKHQLLLLYEGWHCLLC